MPFHPVTFFLLVLGIAVLSISPAYAFLGKDKIPPLKSEVNVSKEQFEAESNLIEETPLQNKDLAFKVWLPKSWIKADTDDEKVSAGADLFRQVASYTTPPRLEHRSIFRVRTIDLNTLIRGDDWFIGYMLQMGFSVEGMTILSPRRVIAQYAVFENGEPYVTRAVVTLSGGKIVLAEYLVHQDNYQKEKDEQIWATSGFTLTSPSDVLPVSMKTFSFADIAKFDYPENWSIYTLGITQISRMEASVLNTINTHSLTKTGSMMEETQMIGRIDVSVISKANGTTLPEEIATLNQGLKGKHYKLGSYIETIKTVDVNPNIKSTRLDVYEMESEVQKLVGYEYWVAVLQTDSRYYLVRLITVGRGENFVAWAQNTETFRILLKSLSPASVQNSY